MTLELLYDVKAVTNSLGLPQKVVENGGDLSIAAVILIKLIHSCIFFY